MAGGVASEFLADAIPEPNTGCWIWLGAYGEGEPMALWRGRRVPARKLAWILEHGTAGGRVVAACDNQTCVNPAHLALDDSDSTTLAPTR
jgi:hypothetical protein